MPWHVGACDCTIAARIGRERNYLLFRARALFWFEHCTTKAGQRPCHDSKRKQKQMERMLRHGFSTTTGGLTTPSTLQKAWLTNLEGRRKIFLRVRTNNIVKSLRLAKSYCGFYCCFYCCFSIFRCVTSVSGFYFCSVVCVWVLQYCSGCVRVCTTAGLMVAAQAAVGRISQLPIHICCGILHKRFGKFFELYDISC
jgi:hypothetical protein